MSHHHKTNATVEGNPDSGGRGRGLPRRPDDQELEQRADLDRIEAGLRAKDSALRRRNTPVVPAEEY